MSWLSKDDFHSMIPVRVVAISTFYHFGDVMKRKNDRQKIDDSFVAENWKRIAPAIRAQVGRAESIFIFGGKLYDTGYMYVCVSGNLTYLGSIARLKPH